MEWFLNLPSTNFEWNKNGIFSKLQTLHDFWLDDYVWSHGIFLQGKVLARFCDTHYPSYVGGTCYLFISIKMLKITLCYNNIVDIICLINYCGGFWFSKTVRKHSGKAQLK